MAEWASLLNALSAKGLSFDRVKGATDRRTVISALGFSDPLDVAVLETEWNGRVAHQAEPTAAAPPAIVNPRDGPLRTGGVEYLQQEPPELQEAVVAQELCFALRGLCGDYFLADDGSGHPGPSPHIPPSLAAMSAPLLAVVPAVAVLERVADARSVHSKSLIKAAVAEAVAEQLNRYTLAVAGLQASCVGRRLPMPHLLAEAEILVGPLVRLARLFEAMHFDTKRGDGVLQDIQTQQLRCAGNPDDERVLTAILLAAARPYVRMLEAWLYEGQLQDPHAEFFVREDHRDWAAGSRQADVQRYAKRFYKRPAEEGGDGPWLDRKLTDAVFSAGRYCHLLRECGAPLPPRDPTKSVVWGDWVATETAITAASDAAGSAVMRLLVEKHRLVERFHSMADFFLHGRGDWLVSFLDIALRMLFTKVHKVKAHTINVLLQAEIHKACRHDAHHASISCSFSPYPLADLVDRLNKRVGGLAPRVSTGAQETLAQWDSVEMLQLEVDCEWPLSLVFHDLFLMHLNCIFRLLLWCKISERALVAGWNKHPQMPPNVVAAKQQMTHFVRQFQFFATHTVLQPMWLSLAEKVASLSTIDAISTESTRAMKGAFEALTMRSEKGFRGLTTALNIIKRFGDLGLKAATAPPAAVDSRAKEYRDTFLKCIARLGDPHMMGAGYPALVPMLTALDFSGFYKTAGVYSVRHGAAAHIEAERIRADDDDGDTASNVSVARSSVASIPMPRPTQ